MTAPALFSLVPLSDDPETLPHPESGPYIVATKHGFMVHQTTHWGRVLIPIAEAPTLTATDSLLWHNENLGLPAELLGQAWGFFRGVWNAKKSEAMVDITWSEAKGYRLFVPPQRATSGGVHANRNPEHYKGQIVGTIHSHCDFNAFHSGTDHGDADTQGGLHITIGHVHQDTLDIAIMVSAGKTNWELKLNQVADGPVTVQPFPAWWLNFVQPPTGQLARPNTPSTWKSRYPAPVVPLRLPGSSQPTQPGWLIGQQPPSTERDDSYDNIQALMYSDPALTDPDLQTLEIVEALLDQVDQNLTELGFDFDYSITRFRSAMPRLSTTNSDDIVTTISEDEYEAFWRTMQ